MSTQEEPKVPNRTLLAVEDECAPDAFDYFHEQLKNFTGYNFREFKHHAADCSDDFSCIYKLGKFTMEYHADSPWWELYENND